MTDQSTFPDALLVDGNDAGAAHRKRVRELNAKRQASEKAEQAAVAAVTAADDQLFAELGIMERNAGLLTSVQQRDAVADFERDLKLMIRKVHEGYS